MPPSTYRTPPADVIESEPIRDALAALERLKASHRDAAANVQQAEEVLEDAIEVDAAYAAEEVRAGRELPDEGRAEAFARAVLDKMRRKEAALDRALIDERAALADVIAEHAPTWRATNHTRIAEARDALAAALNAAEGARRQLAAVLAVADWLDSGLWRPDGLAQHTGLQDNYGNALPASVLLGALQDQLTVERPPATPSLLPARMPTPDPAAPVAA